MSETEAFALALGAYLTEIQEDVPGCKQLKPGVVLGLVAEALDPANDTSAALTYAFKSLAKVWPEDYEPSMNARLPIDQRITPTAIMAVVARIDERLIVRVQPTDSGKPSPGTAFPALSPWRTTLKAKTMEKRFREWAANLKEPTGAYLDLPPEARGVQCAVSAAQRWVGEQGGASVPTSLFGGTPTATLNDDPATDKQLGFIASLARKKGLDAAGFVALLRKCGGVNVVEDLQKPDASDLIEELLALPDADKPSRVKPPSRAKPAKKKPAKKKAKAAAGKVPWKGKLVAVQPRIRQRIQAGEVQHSYLGYVLFVDGELGGEAQPEPFGIGVGKGAQEKHGFQVGDTISGVAVPVADPHKEIASHYKASKLAVEGRDPPGGAPPPHVGAPPPLPDYRERGHRPLGEVTYAETCQGCVWASKQPVDDGGAWRMETVCYGPEDCFFYSAG